MPPLRAASLLRRTYERTTADRLEGHKIGTRELRNASKHVCALPTAAFRDASVPTNVLCACVPARAEIQRSWLCRFCLLSFPSLLVTHLNVLRLFRMKGKLRRCARRDTPTSAGRRSRKEKKNEVTRVDDFESPLACDRDRLLIFATVKRRDFVTHPSNRGVGCLALPARFATHQALEEKSQ